MLLRTFLIALILTPSAHAQPAERPIASRPLDTAIQQGQPLPTGMSLTPAAAPGSQFVELYQNLTKQSGTLSGQPVSSAISPDGKTLLVLTSGYNGTEEVFIYDVSNNAPVLKQYLPAGSAFMGLAWNPSGAEFYVSGGSKDLVYVFALQSGKFAAAAQIPLGHPFGLGLLMVPAVAGLAVNAEGDTLVSVNYLNDSISLVDLVARKKTAEVDLRPGVVDPSQSGIAGGEYPFWVAIRGNDKAYVSSVRDREVVVVSLTGSPAVTHRIPVQGQPNKMVLNHAQSLLLAALDNSDSVAVIDTDSDALLETIPTTAVNPGYIQSANFLKGSNPNALALSPNEGTLYVTNGGTNTLASSR